MVDIIVDDGRDFFEDVFVNDTAEILNTVAVGDGTASPDNSDSSLTNQLHAANDSSGTVTLATTGNTGEIRATIEVTGGNEVPAGSDLTEFGLLTDSSTLTYYEVRATPITVQSGESKTVEILLDLTDDSISSNQVLTNDGIDLLSEISCGSTSDYIDTIAIGDSNNAVSSSDSSMFSEIYRADDSASTVTVASTSNTGDINATITVSAGPDPSDELSAPSDVSEFGIISNNGVLTQHETRNTVTLESGDEQAFKIPFTIID